jgi:hypothetical protein
VGDVPRLDVKYDVDNRDVMLRSQKRSTSKSGRLASGYDPAWLKKTNARNLKDDTLVVGGLTDDDIYDERPDPSNRDTWNKLRSNSNKVCSGLGKGILILLI